MVRRKWEKAPIFLYLEISVDKIIITAREFYNPKLYLLSSGLIMNYLFLHDFYTVRFLFK